MVQHIALLRAVNVGGRSVAMADLRAMLTDLRCTNPRTLLQSGNAVFELDVKVSAVALEKKLEAEAQRRLGFAVAFMLRTAEEWDAIIARNPFAEAAKNDPAHMVLMALKGAPDAAAVKALRDGSKGPETIHVDGRDAYLIYPEGQGNSKLTNALIERKLGVAGTARNWNTVLKLAALAASYSAVTRLPSKPIPTQPSP
jgi:uncharacterized protein (DUF1697 family)